MKKNIFLLLILFPFLFGCSAEYELTINDNKFDENIKIFGVGSSENIKIANNELKYPTFALSSQAIDVYDNNKIEGASYYEKSKYETGGNVGVEYSFSFNKNNLYDSFVVNKCYDLFSVINESNTIIISTSRENKCFKNNKFDELQVHIKTNHKVKESNADSSEDNDFYWTINKKNYNNKTIYIQLYSNQYITDYKSAKNVILIIIGIAILILIAIIFFMKKAKKNNKI